MTHFSWAIDGSIVGLYLLVTMVAGVMVRRYVGKVEHFLVAGREVNVFLGIASLAATEFGVITCMYTAEAGYKYGFAGATPGILNALAMLVVGLTGFCIKPLRDAGVVTIPELFEKRYGPRVRWAAGVVIVLGGLLNMGVFLRITGEFLVLVGGFDLQPSEPQHPPGDDRPAAVGHDLHRRRRHALRAGHRLPAVPRDERRPDRRHHSGPHQRRLEPLGPDRDGTLLDRRVQSVRQLRARRMVLRALQRLCECGGRLDVADHDLAPLGIQGRQDGPTNLHPHQLLLRLSLADPGNLGNRRAGDAPCRRARQAAA